MTPAARRKALSEALRAEAKGSGWRHKQGVLIRAVEPYVLAINTKTVLQDGVRTPHLQVLGKPLALDPLLWSAMGIEGNDSKPVTFRYWGAFTCGWAPLQSERIPDDMTLEAQAEWMVGRAQHHVPGALQQLSETKFSDLIRPAYAARDGRGTAEALVLALVVEGDLAAARAAAEEAKAHRRTSMSNLNHPSFGEKAGKTAVDLILAEAGAT